MFRWFTIICAIFFLSILDSAAQVQNISYHTLTPSNGLSHITVNAIYQDHNHAIWMATRDGLNCYDGTSVKIFRQDKDNPNSLLSNNVNRIVGDAEGHLYIMCNDGVSSFDIESETFTTLIEDQVSAICYNDGLYIAIENSIERWDSEQKRFVKYYSLPDNSLVIRSLLIDSSGRIWIGTQDKGLYTIEKAGELMQRVDDANISQIKEDSHGNVWFGSWSNGLFKFDNISKQLHNFVHDPSLEGSIPTNFIRDITEDHLGNIWLATDQGLCCYITTENDRGGEFESYQSTESTASIWPIITDNQGNIWFGTDFGGASWFNPEYTVYVRYNMVNYYTSTVEHAIIGKIIEDDNDDLWICAEGGGIYIYNRKNGEFRQLLESNGKQIISDNIKAIYHDRERGVMWLGSWNQGLYRYHIASGSVKNYRYDPSYRWSLTSNIILEIVPYQDKLILGTYKSGVAMFDPESEQCERLFIDSPLGRKINTAANLLLDSNNTLWIGAEGYGVFCYDFSRELLTNYRHNKNQKGSISSNNISSIIEDSSGTIWIGHEGAGIDRYTAQSDLFENFDSESSGIVGNRIYQICDNLDNTLSISTGEGLSIFNCETLESRNYSNKMGYNVLSPNENAMCRTRDNMLFIGGVDGLISFDANKFITIPKREYSIKLSSLYVNQQQVQVGDQSEILSKILVNSPSIKLPSLTNSFSINFATTNYIPEIDEPVLFKLEGFDKEWVEARGNVITYTNISPGNYTLQLKAASDSEYISPASLDIMIRSIWYNTAWAWLVYMIIVTALVNYLLSLYQQRLKLSAQVKYEQERIIEVERQNESKLQFFTNISHEFRTPLSVIIGQIEQLLNSKQISGTPRSKVMSIYKSSSELNSLIGELLDFRKHEKGMLKLKISKANLSELLREIHDIYNDYISSRGIEFRLFMPDDAVWISCDAAQLRKVINNLISNAIKYTRRGDTITLSLSIMGENAIIKVEDSGAGIAPHDLQHIFDRFYQSDSNPKISMGGTGIGLAFAKAIIDLHGGNIEVSSFVGEGCTFAVLLPTSLENTTADECTAEIHSEINAFAPVVEVPELLSSDDKASERSVKILLVEDDPQLLSMLIDIFSDQYSVSTATDGAEGIEKAREILPQIILSDIMMPITTGIELCTTLKGDVATSHIPVVLLTARSTTEQTIEGLNCGADDYIVKPFNTNLLLARCNNLVNNRILLQERFNKQPEENTVKMATNALDQKILERAMAIIDSHIDDPTFDIAKFSSEIAMSRTNLFNKIKAITGLTPNDFIMTVRLKRAATMLISNPEMSVTEVAESVGFNGHRYFSKRFKERFGVTPIAYRQGS